MKCVFGWAWLGFCEQEGLVLRHFGGTNTSEHMKSRPA